MLRIRDWSIALEIDIKAAVYVQGEIRERELERERRDREFWKVMFGGEVDQSEQSEVILDAVERRPLFLGSLIGSDDDAIARSPLSRR